MNDTKDLLIGAMDNHKVYLKASEVILLCSEEVRKENDELKMQNEKLADDLNDCIMSNQLLEKEIDNLRITLMNIEFLTPALGGDKKEMKKALLDIDAICRLVLDGEDE